MAYNSKYTGEQVEAQLDKVDGKADKTYVDAEVAAAKEYASGELSSVREDLEAADQDLKLYVDEQTLASKDYTDFKTKDKYVKPSSGIPASDLAPDVFLQGEKGDKGDKGDTGATGPQGPQGVSVSSVAQTTTSTADGGTNVVTVTLSNGTKSTFNVKNGSKGSNGSNGTNGTNGATFTPSVDANGNLSWTNDKGLANPATVNIKGPKGDSGEGGGEDIRYFAEFTVEDVIEASVRNNRFGTGASELKIAAANNKLICIPYRNADKGYVIASYSYIEGSDYSNVYIRLEYNGNVYMIYESDSDYLIADYPIALSGSTVELQIDYACQIEIQDNTFYSLLVEDEFHTLMIGVFEILHKGSTIRFFSSHWTYNVNAKPLVIEIVGTEVLWPNGVVPEIEIDTWYELSLTTSGDGLYCLAVLTPFKPVE